MSSEWISLKEASEKYLIAEGIIHLWIQRGTFTEMRKEGEQIWLNAQKLDKYICSRETCVFDAEYVLEIEHYSFYEKERVRAYALSNTLLQQEIERLRDKITYLGELSYLINKRLDRFVKAQKIILSNIAKRIE